MEQRMSIITLGVKDISISRNFYESLGWSVATNKSSERIVAFNMQGFVIALYERSDLEDDVGIGMKANGQLPFSLAYTVLSENEVDATMGLVEKCGGTIVKLPQKVFWGGYSGYFSDKDGFLWEVAYNPFASHDATGKFMWK